MKRRLFRWTTILYTLVIYLILYIPIVVLMIYSFNESKLNVVWTGFTFKWYAALLHNTDVLNSFKVSMILAAISTVLSAMIGTLAAVGMYRYNFKGKSVLDALLYIPVVIPEIVMGIALLALFAQARLALGMTTLVIAHVAFSIPFVVIVVKARLDGFNRSIEEAAMDLGADRWQTFYRVTLPIIMPGIVSGALLAFTLSLDDVVISFFVAGPQSTTLPLKVFSMVKFGVSPEINALSTIMLLVTLGIVVIAETIRAKQTA